MDSTEKENTTGTVDSITNSNYDKNGSFLMAIEDIFTDSSGTVVTGIIERGTINLNDEVQIIGLGHQIITTTVTRIGRLWKSLDTAEAGENVDLLLRDVGKGYVERGQVVAKPNSIKAATKFDANIYILTNEEGGRNTPISNNYKTHFYFRTIDVIGIVTLPNCIKKIMPGDSNVKITVVLINNLAIEFGTEFNIREGLKTIGKGKITKVY